MNNVIMPPIYTIYCRQPIDGAQTLICCAISDECGTTTGGYFE